MAALSAASLAMESADPVSATISAVVMPATDAALMAGCVSFCDQVDTAELVRLYRTATLLAVPSTYEGFGLPAAEAMSCGAPVVSTTAGALPEVVGDAGLLVPPADPAALAAAIAQLLDDPAKRAALGALARQRILEKFNWHGAAKRTADVYSEAIAQRHTR